jgi:hypothetical protein
MPFVKLQKNSAYFSRFQVKVGRHSEKTTRRRNSRAKKVFVCNMTLFLLDTTFVFDNTFFHFAGNCV